MGHTYSTLRDDIGTPAGAHAARSRRATMIIDGSALMPSRRDANSKVVRMIYLHGKLGTAQMQRGSGGKRLRIGSLLSVVGGARFLLDLFGTCAPRSQIPQLLKRLVAGWDDHVRLFWMNHGSPYVLEKSAPKLHSSQEPHRSPYCWTRGPSRRLLPETGFTLLIFHSLVNQRIIANSLIDIADRCCEAGCVVASPGPQLRRDRGRRQV